MASQETGETLGTSGHRVHLALLGNLAPGVSLARGAPPGAWVLKAEKGRRELRGCPAQMGPPGEQAQWGLGDPQGVRGLRVCAGSPALWVRLACWDPPERLAHPAPWDLLAFQG